MSERRDHSFDTPTVTVATCCYDPAPILKFRVMAEKDDIDIVAKLCYLSWIIGPGRKIRLYRN